MRKALKKLRYQTEFFAPLFGKRNSGPFIAQLKALQDVFGYVNDARMASKLVDIQKAERAGEYAARAAGYIAGQHDAEARHVWRDARKPWTALERSPRFWN